MSSKNFAKISKPNNQNSTGIHIFWKRGWVASIFVISWELNDKVRRIPVSKATNQTKTSISVRSVVLRRWKLFNSSQIIGIVGNEIQHEREREREKRKNNRLKHSTLSFQIQVVEIFGVKKVGESWSWWWGAGVKRYRCEISLP